MGAMIGRADVASAASRIAGRVRRTPVLDPGAGAFGVPSPIVLKLELLQHTGSFKPRGAFNKLLASDVGSGGVITASGGNFGLAVAFAARELGHPAEVFVPSTSPPVKAERIGAQGAVVQVIPGTFDDAWSAMERRATETGATVMHPFDQPEVVAGQGSVGVELSDQAPDADTVLIAVGGGGLIGGIAAWYDGSTRVVGVEPSACPTLHEALAAGTPVDVSVGGLAVDALGPRRVGDIAFSVACERVDEVILVDDDAILAAQRALWRETRLVAEPGGAAALAAIMTGRYAPEPAERVVVVVCGGNADLGFLLDA